MNQIDQPITEKKRLAWIDAARGFAIFGIFMVNAPAFGAPYFLYGGEDAVWGGSVDQLIQQVIDIFFQASFYTLFSLLFGFGAQLIFERRQQQNLRPTPFLFRRFFILLCIGAVHAFLIWHGDILFSYAVMGFVLLAFLRVPSSILLLVTALLAIPPVALFTFLYYVLRDQLSDSGTILAANQAIQAYSSGSYSEILAQNLQDWMLVNSVTGFVFYLFTLLPMFLLGMYFARKRWFHDPGTYRKQLRVLGAVSLGLFLVFKAGPYVFTGDVPIWFDMAQDSFGGPASAVFYLILISLLYQLPRAASVLRLLANVGRMSLSNYLFQSIIMFILFYGFNLYNQWTPLAYAVFVLAFYLLQIVLSHIWFRYFYFGPAEWLWRSAAYGKRQSFKRKRPQTSP